MITTGDKQQETPAKIRWGAHFKATRESMHLSEKEVASRLHLNPNIITLIESESFKNDTPTIFMRGYLRSYARLLNISDKHINQALNDLGLADHTAGKATPLIRNKKVVANNSGNSFTLWSTSLVVLVLIGLVGMWWNTHNHSPVTDSSGNDTTMVSQNLAPASQAPADPTPKELATTQTETPEPVTPALSNPPSEPTVQAATTATNELQPPVTTPAVTATNNAPGATTNPAMNTPSDIPSEASNNSTLGIDPSATADAANAIDKSIENDLPKPAKKHVARNHHKSQESDDMLPDAGLLPEPGLELDSNDTN
jgi:cytoskeleton protein RodZ